MTTLILVDHNIEGYAVILSGAFDTMGWSELFPVHFVTFREIGLLPDSNDRIVWRFAQAHQMMLLTDNRNMKGLDSLEQTLQEENTLTSLPVLTVGNIARMVEREYRERCVTRLAEIIENLENYLGASRLFIP
ncbi:MAG: ACP S-malonyltransferase [Anaerolineales bacterium]|nr:ACP S-malonyltransferase [Anaerolineales bacterium]